MSKQVLRYRDLQARGHGAPVTIWRKVRAGRFPPPEDYAGRPGWRVGVIEHYEQSRPTVSWASEVAHG